MNSLFARVWRGAARSAKSRWRSLPRWARVPLVALAGFVACVLAASILVTFAVSVAVVAMSDDPSAVAVSGLYLFVVLMTFGTIYVNEVYDV